MAQSWGHYVDPDTKQGINAYEQAGLTLRTPSDFSRLSFDELRYVARTCSDLLDSTYKGNYPQSTKDVDALATSMAQGQTLMFMLERDKTAIAIASLVRRGNSMRGALGFAELSKAAKLPGNLAASVSVRHLSKYRLLWAAENMPETDFLYGSPRAALEGRDGTPGGRQAQSVWWGGRRHGIYLPLLTTNVGWNFRVGGIEPLTGFVVPTKVQKWAGTVRKVPIYVPDCDSQYTIRTIFNEGTNGTVTPRLIVAHSPKGIRAITLREARLPSADIVTKYYVTNLAGHLAERSMDEVDQQLYSTISQKVVIESDIATTSAGAHIMRELLTNGWTLVGWQPSEIVYGGVCPMLARINPLELHELIEPVHHIQYFDEGGLGQTRQVLDSMYQAMRSTVSL